MLLQQEKQHVHEKEMQQQKLQEEKKQGQDVNVVHLQEKLRGGEEQEKLLVEEEKREDDADLFLFFLIYIWYELLIFHNPMEIMSGNLYRIIRYNLTMIMN